MSEQRKSAHLRACIEEDVQFDRLTAGFQRYRFMHQALPDLALSGVDLGTEFLGRRLRAPLLISSMTGGTPAAREINENLATAAEALGIAMGVGSQRAAIEAPALATTYQVRRVAPHVVLWANLGAVQLNYGYGVTECRRAVEMIQADALILHLNLLQELLQEGGNHDFRGLLPKIAEVCRRVGVPVIVKEVGWGISPGTACLLFEAGVAAVDVAGAGGTSWARVEAACSARAETRRLAALLSEWGIPTAEAIRRVRLAVGGQKPLIGSGGVRSGLDAAKALALGADIVGLALPLLKPATVSAEAVHRHLQDLIAELRQVAFATGSANVQALRQAMLEEN